MVIEKEENKNMFGKYLKKIMQEKNLSTHDLHKISHVSQPYISQIINGKKPSAQIIARIADALNLSYFDLLGKSGYLDPIKKYVQQIDEIIVERKKLSAKLRKMEIELQQIAPSEEHLEDIIDEHEDKLYTSIIQTRMKISDIDKEIDRLEENLAEISDKDFSFEREGEIEEKYDLQAILQSDVTISLNDRLLTDDDKQKVLQMLKLMFTD